MTDIDLSGAREREIVEELAQHLEDRWHELMATARRRITRRRPREANHDGDEYERHRHRSAFEREADPMERRKEEMSVPR